MRKLVVGALILLAISSSARAADEYLDCNNEATKERGGNGIEVCTRLIESRRWRGLDLARLYSNRSLAYIKNSMLDLALEDISMAIQLAPDYVFAYDNRGDIKRMRGDYSGAIQDFNRAIELDPEFLAAYLDRGMTYQAMRDIERARADFQTVLDRPGRGRPVDDWAKRRARVLLAELGTPTPGEPGAGTPKGPGTLPPMSK